MKDEMDDERRGFLKKVASVSIATAFGGLAVAAKAGAAQPAQPPQQGYKITQKGAPPNAKKPEGSDLRDGDLAKLGANLDAHPDAAIRAVLKQTAMGLASNEGARNKLGQDAHAALRSLNVDLPPGLVPKGMQIPPKVQEAASKKKGWGIGGGHSNWNRWTYHNNHQNYSDYTDWW